MRAMIHDLRAWPAALLLAAALLLGGCGLTGTPPDAGVEEVLQLEHDVLEDPLLKELDALEASLLETPPQEQTPAEETASPAAEPAPAPSAAAPALDPPPAPAAAEPAPMPAAPQAAEEARKVLFGLVRKADEAGITLRVIEARSLTQEELRRIKNGEKVQRYLVTDRTVQLAYGKRVIVQIVEDGTPVAAVPADVAPGQTVRAALNKDGAIVALRILRE